MNATEIKNSKHYNELPDRCHNLYIHKAGSHNVEFYTKIGRGIAEKKNTRVGRVLVGKQDIELLSAIPGCQFEFSNSWRSCYLINGNELQRAIADLIINNQTV